jgi:hypothetical protein
MEGGALTFNSWVCGWQGVVLVEDMFGRCGDKALG